MSENDNEEKTLVCAICGQILSRKPENIPESYEVRYPIRFADPILCNVCLGDLYSIVKNDRKDEIFHVSIDLADIDEAIDFLEENPEIKPEILYEIKRSELDQFIKEREVYYINVAEITVVEENSEGSNIDKQRPNEQQEKGLKGSKIEQNKLDPRLLLEEGKPYFQKGMLELIEKIKKEI